MKNIENTTKRHISITMLTWDLIDEVEAITGQLVFEDDICREIEHDLYCACMNQHNSDSSQTEMEWFIYELTVTMKYGKTEAMKEAAKHLHEMLTKPTTEAQEATNTNDTKSEEEQTMKKPSFTIKCIQFHHDENFKMIGNPIYREFAGSTLKEAKAAWKAARDNNDVVKFSPLTIYDIINSEEE